ncbi:tolloid-like protein 1 [Amphiura filiformis]|uniref:tolloid-like protein 1 n=1 Tax=Amphiura filiformis TaxID=82378 RepID=UPI003B216A88
MDIAKMVIFLAIIRYADGLILEQTGRCQFSVTLSVGDTYNISSPNYPAFYPPNLDCCWIFNADDGAYDTFVVQIHDFNLRSDITNDTNDIDVTQYGCLSSHSCKGYDLCCDLTEGYCVSVLLTSDQRKSLTSPNFPCGYQRNLHHLWYISGQIPDMSIIIQILAFQIQNERDLVIIGNGNDSTATEIIVELTGMHQIRTLSSRDSTIWIEMTTDSNGGKGGERGFHFQLWQTNETDITNDTNDIDVTQYGCLSSHSCKGYDLCCDLTEGYCVSVLLTSDQRKSLTSPNFPCGYQRNLHHLWYISGQIPDMSIIIQILAFQIQNERDLVIIGNGNDSTATEIIVELTGMHQIRTLSSRDSTIWIEMTTDSNGGKGGERGFHFQLWQTNETDLCKLHEFDCGNGFCMDPCVQCDGKRDCPFNGADEYECQAQQNHEISLTDIITRVSLMSRRFPCNYENNTRHTWNIVGHHGFRIVVDIIECQLEDGFAFVTIGDGDISVSSSLITKLTGAVTNASLMSINDRIWIILETDFVISYGGFYFEVRQITNMTEIVHQYDTIMLNDVEYGRRKLASPGFQQYPYTYSPISESNWIIEGNDYNSHYNPDICPESYLCEQSSQNATLPQKCVLKRQLCDGEVENDCPEGDDETNCSMSYLDN